VKAPLSRVVNHNLVVKFKLIVYYDFLRMDQFSYDLGKLVAYGEIGKDVLIRNYEHF